MIAPMNLILYINSVSMSVRQSVEALKPRSLLIKLSPRTRGPKNYSGPRVLTFNFYFDVRFCTAIVVVDEGDIFEIWRVGEEIWVLKNYLGSRVLTFYFYVCFCATTAIVHGGSIFEIWKVSEEILG